MMTSPNLTSVSCDSRLPFSSAGIRDVHHQGRFPVSIMLGNQTPAYCKMDQPKPIWVPARNIGHHPTNQEDGRLWLADQG